MEVDPVISASQVVIATCGATDAGVRAAIGLLANDGSKASISGLPLPSVQGCRALVKSTSADWPLPEEPILLLNFGPNPSSPALSCIVINTVAEPPKQVSLAHEVVALLPQGSTVAVLSALQLPQQQHSAGEGGSPHAALLGSLKALPKGVASLPVLDDSTHINDGLVAALLHFLTASQSQVFTLLLPVNACKASDTDVAHVKQLGDAVAAAFPSAGVSFSAERLEGCYADFRIHHAVSSVSEADKDKGGGDLMYL